MKTKKFFILIGLAGILIVLGGFAGYRGYKIVRQHRLVNQARTYIAKSNYRKAFLVLQRAVKYNPRDVEACRLMADVAEASRSPSALIWRNRVVELNPRSTPDRLALAQTALAMHDYVSATNALEHIKAEDKKKAPYHNAAGTVACAVNLLPEAESHFLEATRLEPDNAVHQLNLAVVRLHGTNETRLEEARASLKTLADNPTNSLLGCQALRELAVDAMRFNQTNLALTLTKSVIERTNSLFQDRIVRLDLLRVTHDPEFQFALAACERQAAEDPGKTHAMATWQMSKLSTEYALGWLTKLPTNAQTTQPVPVLTAECYRNSKNWPALHGYLQNQGWGELEFLRHAYQTGALKGEGLPGAANAEWELAIKDTKNQKQPLEMLLRLAAEWSWPSEGEEILWAMVNHYPQERWAFSALSQLLYKGGRTRPLMQLYNQVARRFPADLLVKNNLAMTALLLEANELKPHDLAKEVYSKASTNLAFISTYAFSLHLQEKDAEALKVMQQLSSEDLENAGIAGYYGLILKATGDAEKAKVYLDRATKAPLLPEEKKIFDRARDGA
jgi:tetratricopeptide (TPR) repeat protein